ncbi:MAG: hypothetical protein ACP5HM_01380 [Anaerolineae bacterium]
MKPGAESHSQRPASSSRQPTSKTEVLRAVNREALARRVLQLLKEELRIQRDRLGKPER